MEGVEAFTETIIEDGGKKRKRICGDAAFAEAKTAMFEAKMRKRSADDAFRNGVGDAAAVEAAAADVASSIEKAALVAAMNSNKAIEKAAKAASDEIAAYINRADFKQTLAHSRKVNKALAEAQTAAGVATDYSIKIGGSMTMTLPFFELPVFHVRGTD